jgi:hypothetical protein
MRKPLLPTGHELHPQEQLVVESLARRKVGASGACHVRNPALGGRTVFRTRTDARAPDHDQAEQVAAFDGEVGPEGEDAVVLHELVLRAR